MERIGETTARPENFLDDFDKSLQNQIRELWLSRKPSDSMTAKSEPAKVNHYKLDSLSADQVWRAYASLNNPHGLDDLGEQKDFSLESLNKIFNQIDLLSPEEAKRFLWPKICLHQRHLRFIPNSQLHFWQRTGLRLLINKLVNSNLVKTGEVERYFQLSSIILDSPKLHQDVLGRINKFYENILLEHVKAGLAQEIEQNLVHQELAEICRQFLSKELFPALQATRNKFGLNEYNFGIPDEFTQPYLDSTSAQLTAFLCSKIPGLDHLARPNGFTQKLITRHLASISKLQPFSPLLFPNLVDYLSHKTFPLLSAGRSELDSDSNPNNQDLANLAHILDQNLPLKTPRLSLAVPPEKQSGLEFNIQTKPEEIQRTFNLVISKLRYLLVDWIKMAGGNPTTVNYLRIIRYTPQPGSFEFRGREKYFKLEEFLQNSQVLSEICSFLRGLQPELCRKMGLTKILREALVSLIPDLKQYRQDFKNNASLVTQELLKCSTKADLSDWIKLFLDFEAGFSYRYKFGSVIEPIYRQSQANFDRRAASEALSVPEELQPYYPQPVTPNPIPNPKEFIKVANLNGQLVPLFFAYPENLPYDRAKDLRSLQAVAISSIGLAPSTLVNLSVIFGGQINWHHGGNNLSAVDHVAHTKIPHYGDITFADMYKQELAATLQICTYLSHDQVENKVNLELLRQMTTLLINHINQVHLENRTNQQQLSNYSPEALDDQIPAESVDWNVLYLPAVLDYQFNQNDLTVA
jgi:hypothetical protein